MIVYAIRKKGTNYYLPRGFSHSELSDSLQPRLFMKKLSAKLALHQWLLGKSSRVGSTNSYGEYDCDIETIKQLERKEEMEIVEFILKEIKL